MTVDFEINAKGLNPLKFERKGQNKKGSFIEEKVVMINQLVSPCLVRLNLSG